MLGLQETTGDELSAAPSLVKQAPPRCHGTQFAKARRESASELAPQRRPRTQRYDLGAHGGGPLRLPIGALTQHGAAAGGHPAGARVALARPACDVADRLDAAMAGRACLGLGLGLELGLGLGLGLMLG